MESCYDLDNHLDEFLTNDFSLNKSWRCFHPPETTSRAMTTLQIYQALRIKRLTFFLHKWVTGIIILLCRFSEKQTVIVPMPDDNVIRFKNATFSIRFFFLIESINPVKVYVFQNGMLLLDEVCDSIFVCFVLFFYLTKYQQLKYLCFVDNPIFEKLCVIKRLGELASLFRRIWALFLR